MRQHHFSLKSIKVSTRIFLSLIFMGLLTSVLGAYCVSVLRAVYTDTATQQKMTTYLIGIIVICMAVAVFLGIMLSRDIRKPLRNVSKHLGAIASGTEVSILETDQYNSEFTSIVLSLNEVQHSLKLMLSDANMLVEASLNGDLTARADIEKHKGGYKDIIKGINKTLDAVIEPVMEAKNVLKAVSEGYLNQSIKGDYKGDHAIIKQALNDTVSILKNYIDEITQNLNQIASGILTGGITTEYKGNFIALKQSINGIIASLSNIITEINGSAEQVANGTRQISDTSQAISQGTTEQASSIEELSASVTHIAEQTKQNAANANKANELALSAQSDAIAGNDYMKEMQTAMREINESSQSISKIIKVIDDIAFQTNILALNAAVEAARAGIHGKGFAVVAEEVRNLAARSADAAKETTGLIEGSIRKVAAGTMIADQTASALSGIVTSVEKAVGLVGQIALASNEQATGISQVDQGIEQLSQVVQTNSATAEETAAAGQELSSQAELLKSLVAQFKLHNVQAREETPKKKPALSQEYGEVKIDLSDKEYGKY